MKSGVVAATLLLILAMSNVASAAQQPTNDDCLACHSDSSLTTEVNGKSVSLYVDPDKFSHSMHGSMFTCVDCHTDVKTSPHENTPAKVSCATCHADEQAAWERSFHAKSRQSGGMGATCTDCHGSPHELLSSSDPKSRTNHANIPATCGSCHNQKFIKEVMGGAQPFAAYEESVHGRAVANGVEKAAVCTDCHSAHDILPPSDPKSPIFKFNVPETCGKCHNAVEKEFMQSIHGQAIARGEWQAPVCTDCHGIHSIKSHTDPSSPVSAQNLAENTCARCHEGVRLSQEFGFEGTRVSTYLSSYHGLAAQRGSTVVANCASCHGVHDILPSSDPRSSINPANLVKTCGQCHRGVTANFVSAKVHVNAPSSNDVGSVVVRWVRKFYVLMIVVVIGGMLAHNFIIWRFKAIQIRQRHAGHMVTRMTGLQRIQHMILFTSFIVLVLTGFALRFPESIFFHTLVLGMNENLRGLTHRIAGLVLIGIGSYHVFYAMFRSEGRKLVRDLWPTLTDLRDTLDNLTYHMGFGTNKPRFGRFTYAEKVEYWALVWGTIVMAATGIMLWAKIFVGNHLPRWWIDVATAIHFYEAILATLAILIWHFYQVFFDPDTYPMNWAWWDGKVSVEHYHAEHPLDVQSVQDSEHHAKHKHAEEHSSDDSQGTSKEQLEKDSDNEA
jgi:cytochrome b subunit of formate dehydrogenase/nitrate/TMAO reductase-like tetraheme cytochrome c subunit